MKDEEKARELIEEIYPSTSMGDYGLKEQLLLEAMKWKEQEILEKLENFLKGIYLPYYADNSHIDVDNDELIKDIKKAILGERENDNS